MDDNFETSGNLNSRNCEFVLMYNRIVVLKKEEFFLSDLLTLL